MSTQNIQFHDQIRKVPQIFAFWNCQTNILVTQKQVWISHGKRAIWVWAIEAYRMDCSKFSIYELLEIYNIWTAWNFQYMDCLKFSTDGLLETFNIWTAWNFQQMDCLKFSIYGLLEISTYELLETFNIWTAWNFQQMDCLKFSIYDCLKFPHMNCLKFSIYGLLEISTYELLEIFNKWTAWNFHIWTAWNFQYMDCLKFSIYGSACTRNIREYLHGPTNFSSVSGKGKCSWLAAPIRCNLSVSLQPY